MKRIILLFITFICIQVIAQSDIPNAPVPPKLVNDFTGTFLKDYEIKLLEDKLVAYDDSTSTQIVVVIVDDLKGKTADDYAISLGQKWGVGGKQFNNGIVLLIATGDKDGNRKYFIATGYGIEASVTDLLADRIGTEILRPQLQSGNHYAAVSASVEAIEQALAGKYKAPEGYRNRSKGGGMSIFKIILIIIIVVVIIALMSGGNNNGGRYVSRRGYKDRDSWGGGGWYIPSGGSNWGGGGSSGGGGFGGFGGGGFGGGGAGGSW